MENKDDIIRTAASLKKNLSEDLVGTYKNLLEFSELHAPNSKVKEETILLGSSIFESLGGGGGVFALDATEETQLLNRATMLVDAIMEESIALDQSAEISRTQFLRERFLAQKPEKDIVFTGEGIAKHFPKGGFKLQDIDLTLKLGEITGVVGENGNGKTTLLRIIAGDLSATSGILKYPLFARNNDWCSIKKSIGYIRQNLPVWNSLHSVKEHLHFTAAIKGIRGRENEMIVKYIINRLSLGKYQDAKWGELSGGFRLRFELARQLLWKPKLLILDEPLANLDIKAQALILTDLRNLASSVKHAMAIIISSQNLHEIESIADNIIFIKEGKSFYNGPVGEIGMNFDYRCYELGTNDSVLELQKKLVRLNIREIRANGQSVMLFTGCEITSNILLENLIRSDVTIKFFRDISHSTRLLFER